MSISKRDFLDVYKHVSIARANADRARRNASKVSLKGRETVEEFIARGGKVQYIDYCVRSSARSLTIKEQMTIKNGNQKIVDEYKRERIAK